MTLRTLNHNLSLAALLCSAICIRPVAGIAETNQVLSLNGTSAYASIPSAADLQNPTEITVEAWIYPVNTGKQVYFINKGDSGFVDSPRTYELSWQSGTVIFSVFLGTGTWAATGIAAPAEQWAHIAGTYSSADSTLRIYKNGVMANSTTNDASGNNPLNHQLIRQTTMPLVFGAELTHPLGFAAGKMDEIRVWNKSRTQDEIAESMSCRLTGGEPNLAGYWSFDDATAADLTGHGHNGTLAGGAVIEPLSGDDLIHPASRPTYTIVDIGNNTASGANAVNNEGAVVGDSVVASGGYHAFLYTNGFLFDIGTLGQISCHSVAINDAGEITGFVGNSLLGDEGSIMWAFLYKGGLMTDLAALIPNHQKSWGCDINNAGQVVGWYVSSAGQRPFLYSNGTIQDLGFDGFASSINDSGQIVGAERVGGEYRVVVISSGIKQVLSNLGNASVGHINNSGQIVGNFTASTHAYLYSTGQVVDLGTLGGNTSQASCLNNHGQVVGQADTTNGTVHAYVYRQGTMLDLNSLIPNNSGWVLTQAYGINDSGLIVGVGKKSGVGRAFLLVPTGTNPPVTNQVLSLDGSSGYATVPDSSPLRLSSGDFSVTAWVWLSSYDTFGTAIMVKRESGSGRGWMFSVAGAAQLGGQALRPAFGVSENSDPRVFGTTVITTNEWHHVAVTYNAAKSFAELYMDGVLSGTNNLPQPMSTSSPLYIGRDSKVPQYFLNGRLDEVSIWNRALTQGEILSMKSCPLPRSDANLVAYWNFDDGTASDVTGHGHNGTFAGNAQAVLIQGTDAVHAGCGSEPLGRVAIGNATVMNGFIIDATITDGGFGYTNTPTVRIFEGGGSGAQAVAVVSNGVVTAIHILDAGSGYTNQPVMVIAPPFIEQPLMGVTAMSLLSFSNLADGTTYQLQAVNGGIWSNIGTAFTASNSTFTRYVPGTAGAEDYWLASLPVSAQAIATVQVVNGFVVGATVTSGGSGYVTNPAVTISGGGGANAAAMAHVSGGVVTAITITSAGIGYTDTPTIIIAPPPVNALWPTMAQVMKLDLRRLAPYDNYQLEFCPLRGGSWSNYTAPFIPTSATNTLYINVTGNAGFMRAKHLPGVNPFEPQGMVWINPGTFTMGSPSTEQDHESDEGPQTVVTLTKGYWMSKYETSQAEYQSVMGSNPSYFTGDTRRPVENVSWNDATNYCGKLTVRERAAGRLSVGYEYRLPMEAEWEYACRAGTTTRFSYGDDSGYSLIGQYAWYDGNSGNETHAVGGKQPNAWGLYDMHGNVWEWCLDWYGTLPGGSVTNPKGASSGSERVRRGGSYGNGGDYCRSAKRLRAGPGERHYSMGFRPVLVQVP